MARNIVTFDKYRKPRNDCRDGDYGRDDPEAVFILAQALTALNARFAFVESEQTATVNDVIVRLQRIEALLSGGEFPTLANTPFASSLPVGAVTGAPAAFDSLATTADDQDDRLTQLEAA